MNISNFILARLQEDIMAAMEASKFRHGGPAVLGGVHWFWSTDQDEDALVDPEAEFIGDEHNIRVSLRSREECQVETLGGRELPQFALYAEEVPYGTGVFITRFDPARIVREATAKRRIVIDHEERSGRCRVCTAHHEGEWRRFEYPCWTLVNMAEIYQDHPDYQDRWRAE